jgi:hypothetical protein
MRLKLRSKGGGRLELLDESGNPVDGVKAIELIAIAPDFVPRLRVEIERPSVAIDAETTENASQTGEKSEE